LALQGCGTDQPRERFAREHCDGRTRHQGRRRVNEDRYPRVPGTSERERRQLGLVAQLGDEHCEEGRANEPEAHGLAKSTKTRARPTIDRRAIWGKAQLPMLSAVEKVLFLKSIDLFSQIPGEDLAQVALISTEEQKDLGEEIFAEGESGDALFLVIDGKVRVHKQDRMIAELGERECFGEMALLDAAPRSATVTALSETNLLKITREDFEDIMSEKPEIAMGIIKVLTRRLRDAIR
jgi:CRP/FNR family transcriptional regulator, cyclic AMP receptor protein